MNFGALTRACTAGFSAVALLSGCVGNVSGTAVRAKSSSLFGAEKDVYEAHHWTAVRDEVAREPSDGNDHWVQQTIVLYPAADDAQMMFADSTASWERCGNSAVATDSSDSSYIWEIDAVDVKDDLIVQVIMQEESGGWECQHVMAAVSNVTIETWACADGINDEAVAIAQRLIANTAKK